MINRMTLDEFKQHAVHGLNIPVWRQIPADTLTPVSIFQALVKPHSRAFLLDSAEHEMESGRYSFIGFDPILHFESYNHEVVLTNNTTSEKITQDPIETLRKTLKSHKTIDLPNLPPFCGGAVGYFLYDSVRLFEQIPDRHGKIEKYPDILFNFYETTIAFDHKDKILTLFHVTAPSENLEKIYQQAIDKIDEKVQELAITAPHVFIKPQVIIHPIEEEVSDETFKKMVLKAKEHIHNGDIFQVVLSRTFKKKTAASAFDIFRALRMVSPSPYLFYLQEPEYQVAGSSPERLVQLKKGILKTNPLAGTSPRPTKEMESQVEAELLANEKECAEHMMLVDLGRNDLGSISQIGTVHVKNLKSILRLSHVIHISSEVESKINTLHDGLDAIRATLPAGTLSGAPKIRAMEIIDAMEMSRRNLYGGAICYLDNQGNLDSCIAIRMAIIRNGVVSVRTGAGIVYDSDPQKEADETRHKARGVIKAIEMAEEGFE